MRRYVIELDKANKVREFDSVKAFETTYFQYHLDDAYPSLKDINGFEKYSDTEIKWLENHSLSKDSPFSPAPLVFELNLDDLKVTSVDRDSNEVVFGVAVKDLIEETILFKNLIPAKIQKHWDVFLETLKNNGSNEACLLFQDKDNIWAVHASGTKEDDHFKVEFRNLYTKVKDYFHAEEENNDVQADEFQLLGTIHMIVIKSDLIPTKNIKKWSVDFSDKLKRAKYYPENNQTRIMISKYDDDGVEKANFISPFIDDLICLPLDRLIFLQKVEFVLGMPERIRPSHLFTQSLSETISISKKSAIKKINDLAITINNPVRLKKGVAAHVYFSLDNEDNPIDLYTKVIDSRPHATLEKTYETELAFFGANREKILAIKKFLADKVDYHNLLNSSPQDFKINLEDPFLREEDKRQKTIVIIDPDQEVGLHLKNIIETEIDNVKVVLENSYYMFVKKHLNEISDKVDAVEPISQRDLFRDEVKWLINGETKNMIQALTPYSGAEKLVGHEVKEVLEGPQNWMKLFQNNDSKELINEGIHSIHKGGRVIKQLHLTTPDGSEKLARIEFSKEFGSENLKVTLTVPPAEHSPIHEEHEIDHIDAIIIDNSFIPQAVQEWIIGLNNQALKTYPKTQDHPIRLIVMAEESPNVNFKHFLDTPVQTVLFKPLENKRVLYHVTNAINSEYCIYNKKNIGWYERTLICYIAKEALLVEIAEYGCAIKLAKPLTTQTPIYLHEFIFENAPDGNLCAKVLYVQKADTAENPDKESTIEGDSLCYLLFFGINDAFLKFTRSWIRESYAQKKEKIQNS